MTHNNLWSPLKTIGLMYSMYYTNKRNMRSVKASLLEIQYHVLIQGFNIWPMLTPNDLWRPPKQMCFLYSIGYTYIINMRSVQVSLLEILCLQGYTIWPLLTPDDLWPPPNTIGFLYSMWYTYIPHMRSVQASLLEISCLQARRNRHTYTDTHIHAIMNAKVTIVIETKKCNYMNFS